MGDLDRFVLAQERAYDGALAELRRGRKTSHWMWFVLPQLRGLGSSPTSQRFGIAGLDEARDYLAHPVLGPRLHECCEALLSLDDHLTAEDVLGPVDALKLRSSMTLFDRATDSSGDGLFARVLDRYWDGVADRRTDELLGP